MVDGKEKTVTVNDKTNKKSRADLKKLMKQGKLKIYDRMLGSHIGHNKFIVYVDPGGTPQRVLTGSTNWTATGLCGQTNNMVIIESPKIAKGYLDYWQQLKSDKLQAPELRDWCCNNGQEYLLDKKKTEVHLRFSPIPRRLASRLKTLPRRSICRRCMI
jgi:phosphatidylserine/phosphatidylglycerophosphate/cardiolipin synthase-like enzyme